MNLKPDNEKKRIAALYRYHLLDTAPEQAFDDFAELASMICKTPIAAVSLVDTERQWFKARVGFDALETPREQAFCAHTILGDETMVIEDASRDVRFATNPLVTSGLCIRFYAGAPLIDREGNALGSLCVIDRQPRMLSLEQRQALEKLARQVMMQMELRHTSAQLAEVLAEMKTLHSLLPICSHCKGIRDDAGYWQSVESYLSAHTNTDFSHGICPVCFEKHFPEIFAQCQKR